MAKKKKTTVTKKKAAKAARSSAAKKVKAAKKAKVTGSTKKRAAKKAPAKTVTKTKASTKKKKVASNVTRKKTSTSTGTKGSKKKASPLKLGASALDGDSGDSYEEVKIPKTKLTDKQLAMFRQMLIEKRRELLGDVRMLTRDALGKPRQESSGDLSNVPIHMADVGSDNWEQDFTIGLIANERQLVREIDEALARIEDRTYGVCLGTLKRISVARLRAKPWAKYSIEHARELEQRRG